MLTHAYYFVEGTMTQNSHPGGEDIEEQFKLVRDDVARLARLIRQIGETKSTEARDAALAEEAGRSIPERARAFSSASWPVADWIKKSCSAI